MRRPGCNTALRVVSITFSMCGLSISAGRAPTARAMPAMIGALGKRTVWTALEPFLGACVVRGSRSKRADGVER